MAKGDLTIVSQRQSHVEKHEVQRTAIVILGARSGTSALAGTLGLLGCALPRNLMPANFANEKGYFEPQDIVEIHDAIFKSVNSSWSDWREFPQGWFSTPACAHYADVLAETFTNNYGEAPLSVLKDPRLCRLLPLWISVFARLHINPVFAFSYRDPAAVALSLGSRDGSSRRQGICYWLRNWLESECSTRGFCRSFLSYDALLSDWQATIGPFARELGLSLRYSKKAIEEVNTFLDSRLRHTYMAPPSWKRQQPEPIRSWIEYVDAQIFRAALGGHALDMQALDTVRHGLNRFADKDLGLRLLCKCRHVRDHLVPDNSRRRRCYDHVLDKFNGRSREVIKMTSN